ncbi:MAG: hypothetical protein NTY77_07425 [Elusimicrobia bacterium]|nr:hypothetical protein [Elusimicrobiota bacterium]
MDTFKKLFGIEKSLIKPDCILSPLNEVDLFSGSGMGARARGDYFRAADCPQATVIGTRYSLLAGDCVLHLADSPCRNIYLFNCCGGLGAGIGAAYSVRKAFDFESFSGMLAGKAGSACYLPDAELAREFSSYSGLPEGNCATVGSLALEETHLPRFRALGVDCLDMECSAVFSAAKKAGKRALALLYVSNSVPDKPWHEHLDRRDIERLGRSRKDLAALLRGFLGSIRKERIMMIAAFLFLMASCGLAAEGGKPDSHPAAESAHETLFSGDFGKEVSHLTPAQRDMALLIQRSHYQNLVEMLRTLKISARDKEHPEQTVSCSLASEVKPQDVPVVRAQPGVWAESQQAISAGVIKCGEHAFFTRQSIRDVEEGFSALFFKNSGTAFCVIDENCEAFWNPSGSEEPTPVVSSVLTDGIFTTGVRRFFPGLRAQLDGAASQALSAYGEKHPDFGKPWPRYPQAPPGPEPKAVCRRNLCRLAGR